MPVTFDKELSTLRVGRFIRLLQNHLSMRSLVVGPDFAMGHGREGNVSMLLTLGQRWDFSLHVVEPLVDDQGHVIRSTAVRESLSCGDVARVATQMGRNFTLSGTVVRGKGRGMPLGFPTVNLRTTDGMAIPGDGIYATLAHVGGQRLMAATNVGSRPTFEDGGRTVEAFILDFDGDLYGQKVRLEFVQRLRDEIKFDTVEALKQQVARDVERAREVLRGAVIVSET